MYALDGGTINHRYSLQNMKLIIDVLDVYKYETTYKLYLYVGKITMAIRTIHNVYYIIL